VQRVDRVYISNASEAIPSYLHSFYSLSPLSRLPYIELRVRFGANLSASHTALSVLEPTSPGPLVDFKSFVLICIIFQPQETY
jgi:hypothetical protein